jgi:hypothetical protein
MRDLWIQTGISTVPEVTRRWQSSHYHPRPTYSYEFCGNGVMRLN